MTGELVRALPSTLASSDQRVFRLSSNGKETCLYSMSFAEIKPGMQGDFVVVNGQPVYIFADQDIELSREIVCAVGGAKMDQVDWLPDDQLNMMDITCMTPLALYRRLQLVSRPVGTVSTDRAWGLKRFAEGMLGNRVRMEDESPWQKGLVLHGVSSAWDSLCKILGSEGESFWGWALEHTRSKQDEEGDESRRKVMSGWMNAVKTYLLNEYEIPWVGQYTWDDFMSVPISKCLRSCGTTRRGAMTARMVAGLFDGMVKVNKMRHLLGQGDIPAREEERVDADQVVAEMEPEDVAEAVQEAAAELAQEQWVPVRQDAAQLPTRAIRREYDSQTGVFYFWKDGHKITALVVGPSRDDPDLQEWIEEIIASTRVQVSRFVDA